MSLYGVDISGTYQPGFNDWSKDFYFFKITEGVTETDSWVAHFWASCQKLKGLYHFAHPENNTADAEAAHFIAEVKKLGLTAKSFLVAVLDYERTPYGRAWAARWIALVKAAFPYARVGLYANLSGLQALGGPIGDFLWLAHPDTLPAGVVADIWQYGIKGVDQDKIVGKNPWEDEVTDADKQDIINGIVKAIGLSGQADSTIHQVCTRHDNGLLFDKVQDEANLIRHDLAALKAELDAMKGAK